MSSTDYTSHTPQDFVGTDTDGSNGTATYNGDSVSGGWQLKQNSSNYVISSAALLTYTYANGAGVWYHPHLGTSVSGTGSGTRIQLIFDPTNPNPAHRRNEFDFLESDAFTSGGPGTLSVNSGTITQDNFGTLSFQVNPGSNANETYSISLNNVDKASIVPNGVPPWYHNYTYAAHTAIGYGTWRLYDQNGVLDDIVTQQSATPPPTAPPASSTKKVHCNFW